MARTLSTLALAALLALGLLGLPAPDRRAEAASDFAWGVIVDTTDARSMKMAREAGFTHAKMMLQWANVEPAPGDYVWNRTKENDFDNIMKAARNEGMKLVVRVDGVPAWAGGSPANADLAAVSRFYENAARYGAGTVVAYEILNEPNLDREWGGPPNAAAYTEFLKAAYRGIKAGDPNAKVLGGGPAPGTGNNPGATIEDVDFINGMYDAGAKGFMDALSVHNYGGNTPPETDPGSCTICFRRAEIYRDIMVQRGDVSTPVWLTEWGYLVDPGQNLGQYDWMKVSPEQQADYIVRALRYARENWPWLEGSLLFNIDGATSPYQNYGAVDAKPWFGILNADYTPRPAWLAIQQYHQELSAAEQQPAQSAPEQPASPPAGDDGAGQPNAARLRVVGTAGEGVRLRAAPGLSARAITVLPEGAVVIDLGETRQVDGLTWRSVRMPDGTRGWVAGDYLAPAAS